MLRQGRTSIKHMMINLNAAKVVVQIPPSTIVSSTPSGILHSPPSANVRPLCTMNNNYDPQLDRIFDKKRSLRTQMRRELKKMDPIQRSQEDDAIQRLVLEAPWFKNSCSICAYISSDALREVDTSKIASEILSNPETVMQATDPVDLIILPGLAFDRLGRRLGRSGGYYDMFLRKYQELVKKQNWKQPLLVALSYSIQITENERIAVTPYDVPVDALVSPSGFIPISPIAFKNSH